MQPVLKARNSHISRTLALLAKLWISLPVSYLIYAGFFLGLGPEDFLKVLLNPFYWFVGAIAVVAGNGLLRIHWYGWYLFIFSNLLVLYETASILTFYSHSEHKFFGFIGMIALQGVLLHLVAREVRVPYFFPRIRWWESDPRYRLSVQARIIRKDGGEMEGEIMDISLGGCFVKTHAYFANDETVTLEFSLFERPMKCTGCVVWKTESRVTHPSGIGVKFDVLGKEEMLALKQATRKLQQLSRVYTQATRERNWEEYLQRERNYQGRPLKARLPQPKSATGDDDKKK